MAVTTVQLRHPLELGRGETAVCIPITSGVDLLQRCLESVAAHTPNDTPVLIVDGTPHDPVTRDFMGELQRAFHYLPLADSAGPVQLANAGLRACADADVVLLASHTLVFEGWLERISDAGRSDTTVATASALGNNAGPLSLWGRYDALPGDLDLERLAIELAARSPRATPRTPTAEGHCVWISRPALELTGELDTAFGSLRAAVVDLAQRCLVRGLANVVADDVFVPSVKPGLSAEPDPLEDSHDRTLLEERYPYLQAALKASWPPFARAMSCARRSLGKLAVTVDARILRQEVSGAQMETLELIETLSRMDEVAVRVVLDPAIGTEAQAVIERSDVEQLSIEQARADARPSDIVHRPYQVTSPDDLALLACLGDRLVITHLDLIAFHNLAYFNSFEGWHHHRRVTRHALAMADRVIFRTEHAARDAVREGLVDWDRARVMPMAVNRQIPAAEACRPAKAPDGPYLLCVGNDFRHKNRVFAIKLLAELRKNGWPGSLVLAGAYVGHGSSRGEEAAYRATRPDLAKAVVDMPSVSEAEKSWLYANAAAVVYPTLYEGFGLIPFEAVRAGIPCLFAAQASLAETLPPEAAVLVQWDAEASAHRVMPLLREGDERERHLALLKTIAEHMDDWGSISAKLLEVYEEAIRVPAREAASLAAEAGEREAELTTWIRLKENMGEVVGPDAPLPEDAQRGLVAIASRKRLRRLFSLLAAVYRIGHRVRQR
jgi:glycosyltransferase involved in cell wall biosynthesis